MAAMKNARALRERRGEGLAQVAAAIGITVSGLSRFETEPNRQLRWPWLGRLAAYYGVTEADLMRPADAKTKGVPA